LCVDSSSVFENQSQPSGCFVSFLLKISESDHISTLITRNKVNITLSSSRQTSRTIITNFIKQQKIYCNGYWFKFDGSCTMTNTSINALMVSSQLETSGSVTRCVLPLMSLALLNHDDESHNVNKY